jgi:uncharacterized protein YozE (UPF0346 family)
MLSLDLFAGMNLIFVPNDGFLLIGKYVENGCDFVSLLKAVIGNVQLNAMILILPNTELFDSSMVKLDGDLSNSGQYGRIVLNIIEDLRDGLNTNVLFCGFEDLLIPQDELEKVEMLLCQSNSSGSVMGINEFANFHVLIRLIYQFLWEEKKLKFKRRDKFGKLSNGCSMEMDVEHCEGGISDGNGFVIELVSEQSCSASAYFLNCTIMSKKYVADWGGTNPLFLRNGDPSKEHLQHTAFAIELALFNVMSGDFRSGVKYAQLEYPETLLQVNRNKVDQRDEKLSLSLDFFLNCCIHNFVKAKNAFNDISKYESDAVFDGSLSDLDDIFDNNFLQLIVGSDGSLLDVGNSFDCSDNVDENIPVVLRLKELEMN